MLVLLLALGTTVQAADKPTSSLLLPPGEYKVKQFGGDTYITTKDGTVFKEHTFGGATTIRNQRTGETEKCRQSFDKTICKEQ